MPGETAGSRRLRWIQPSFREYQFELRDGDALVARMDYHLAKFAWEFTNPRTAHTKAGDRRWRFWVTRHGLAGMIGLSAVVHVSGADTGELPAGSFASRGPLELSDGRRYFWNGRLARGTQSTFGSGDPDHPTPLVLFSSGAPLERVVTFADVTAMGQQSADWPLLISLGLYMRLLIRRNWR